MGGVGKTALAAHLAYMLRPHFPDGVLWARVDTSDPMSILNTFARAYGVDVSQYTDLDSRSRTVRDLMSGKRALMILDSVSQSAQIEPLLPPSGSCAVLITAKRRDLAITRGAKRYLLGPFDRQGGEALHLFSRVLGERQATAEQHALLEIANLLGQLPLAIDIVASRLAFEPGWSAADFLRRLQDQQQRLRVLAYEEQNVQLTFQWSCAALTPSEQHFFASLGIITGEDFSVDAAAFVAFGELTGQTVMQAEDILRRLFGLSLVRRGRPGRYRQHPLLRDFARQQLTDIDAAQMRMVQFFVDFAGQQERNYGALELEYHNILQALQSARQLEMWPEFLAGVSHSYHYLEARGLYDVAAQQLQLAENVARQLQDLDKLVFILRCQGRIAERRGHYLAAERIFEEGLRLARQEPETPVPESVVSDLLRGLGVLAAYRGDLALAEAHYQEGLLLARRLEQPDTLGSLLRGISVEAFTRGDYARAEALFEEGLALPHVTDEYERQGALLWALGMLAEDQGDLEEAAGYLLKSAEFAEHLGHLERQTLVLFDLGTIALELEEPSEAARYLTSGLDIARQLGHPWRVTRFLAQLGELALAERQWAAAATCFREVQTIAEQSGSLVMAAFALFGLARAAHGLKQGEAARRDAQTSLEIFKRIGHYQAGEVEIWLLETARKAH
jgi:tetratricopeptide (TPR) repeat protein